MGTKGTNGAQSGALTGTPASGSSGTVDVAVTVTMDQEVRKLDDNTLGWGNEKVISTSTQRVGSDTRRFSIEVGAVAERGRRSAV
jgi:hypothetical protein